MAYQKIYNFPVDATDGKDGMLLIDALAFSSIFDGVPQYYIGSIITIEETLLLQSKIIPGEEHLVDVDYRWFDPKVYFGTYQMRALVLTPIETEAEGGQGFITNERHIFRRISYYSIIADNAVPVAAGSILTLDNCTFQLTKISASFGGVTAEIQTPTNPKSLFSGYISEQRTPLKNKDYAPFFKSIGLFYYPGCAPSRIEHSIRAVNTITSDAGNYPSFSCSILGG